MINPWAPPDITGLPWPEAARLLINLTTPETEMDPRDLQNHQRAVDAAPDGRARGILRNDLQAKENNEPDLEKSLQVFGRTDAEREADRERMRANNQTVAESPEQTLRYMIDRCTRAERERDVARENARHAIGRAEKAEESARILAERIGVMDVEATNARVFRDHLTKLVTGSANMQPPDAVVLPDPEVPLSGPQIPAMPSAQAQHAFSVEQGRLLQERGWKINEMQAEIRRLREQRIEELRRNTQLTNEREDALQRCERMEIERDELQEENALVLAANGEFMNAMTQLHARLGDLVEMTATTRTTAKEQALPPVGGLEWNETADGNWEAESEFGRYQVWLFREGDWAWQLASYRGPRDWSGNSGYIDAKTAKGLAQIDHDRRQDQKA